MIYWAGAGATRGRGYVTEWVGRGVRLCKVNGEGALVDMLGKRSAGVLCGRSGGGDGPDNVVLELAIWRDRKGEESLGFILLWDVGKISDIRICFLVSPFRERTT